MDMFAIDGGHPLRGEATVNGSKNAALPIMASALMISGPVQLHRIPVLQDVATMARLLASLGVAVAPGDHHSCHSEQGHSLWIDAAQEPHFAAPEAIVRQMRAGICVLGPLLARCHRARVPLPGGCRIGMRPIDLHLHGLAALGADLRLDADSVTGQTSGLRGGDIWLGGPFGSTVTGTCNIMSAAVLARGRTTIRCAACEPEVVDLGQFLIRAGAEIQGLGTDTIEIRGVDQLQPTEYEIIPDRIETATLALAAAITQGDILLHRICLEHLDEVLAVLQACGISLQTAAYIPNERIHGNPAGTRGLTSLRVVADRPLRPVHVTARPYQGWPTDAQAQLTAVLTLVQGQSQITDAVFPERFLHIPELRGMGADVVRDGDRVTVRGVRALQGTTVCASDLRASAALVLAGLAANGQTIVRHVHHLDRGYAAFDRTLNALGARISRVPDVQTSPPVPDSHITWADNSGAVQRQLGH